MYCRNSTSTKRSNNHVTNNIKYNAEIHKKIIKNLTHILTNTFKIPKKGESDICTENSLRFKNNFVKIAYFPISAYKVCESSDSKS